MPLNIFAPLSDLSVICISVFGIEPGRTPNPSIKGSIHSLLHIQR